MRCCQSRSRLRFALDCMRNSIEGQRINPFWSRRSAAFRPSRPWRSSRRCCASGKNNLQAMCGQVSVRPVSLPWPDKSRAHPKDHDHCGAVGGRLSGDRGELSIGQLIAFNMLSAQVTGPLLRLVNLWQEFQQVGISVQRLGDVLNTNRSLRTIRIGRRCPKSPGRWSSKTYLSLSSRWLGGAQKDVVHRAAGTGHRASWDAPGPARAPLPS